MSSAITSPDAEILVRLTAAAHPLWPPSRVRTTGAVMAHKNRMFDNLRSRSDLAGLLSRYASPNPDGDDHADHQLTSLEESVDPMQHPKPT